MGRLKNKVSIFVRLNMFMRVLFMVLISSFAYSIYHVLEEIDKVETKVGHHQIRIEAQYKIILQQGRTIQILIND